MEAPLPPQPKYVYSVHSEEGRPAFPPVPYGPMFAPDVRDTEFWTGNPVWCPGSAPTAQDALGTAVPARSLEARLCQAYQCHSGRMPLCNGHHGMCKTPTGAAPVDLGKQWRGKALGVDIHSVSGALSRPPRRCLLSFAHHLLSHFIDKRIRAHVGTRRLTASKC